MIILVSTRPHRLYQTWLENYAHDPLLTFDEPLYWKAIEITTHEQEKCSFNKTAIMLGT